MLQPAHASIQLKQPLHRYPSDSPTSRSGYPPGIRLMLLLLSNGRSRKSLNHKWPVLHAITTFAKENSLRQTLERH